MNSFKNCIALQTARMPYQMYGWGIHYVKPRAANGRYRNIVTCLGSRMCTRTDCTLCTTLNKRNIFSIQRNRTILIYAFSMYVLAATPNKKNKKKREENQKPNVSDVITICGNSNLLQFNVVLSRAQRTPHTQSQTKCKTIHHKWICARWRQTRLFALCGLLCRLRARTLLNLPTIRIQNRCRHFDLLYYDYFSRLFVQCYRYRPCEPLHIFRIRT